MQRTFKIRFVRIHQPSHCFASSYLHASISNIQLSEQRLRVRWTTPLKSAVDRLL